MKKKKQWKRVVDNKMKWQGDTDLENKVIRINKKKSKKKSSVLDTIYHENYHKDHPKAHEKTVYKKTKENLKRLSRKKKQKLYNQFKK